jgi:hypothetical protein
MIASKKQEQMKQTVTKIEEQLWFESKVEDLRSDTDRLW